MSELEELKKKLKEGFNVEPQGKYKDDIDYCRQLYEYYRINKENSYRSPAMEIATEIIGQPVENFDSIREKLYLIENLCKKVGCEFKDPVSVAIVIGLYMKKK